MLLYPALILAAYGALTALQVPGSDAVLCYITINNVTGACEELLGDGVSEEDCCLNQNYGFQINDQSDCQPCGEARWSLWSEWSQCSVLCLEGVQQRSRIRIGQGNFNGDSVEVRACSLQDCCPVSGGWSEWASWSQCSATCQDGQQQRTRECNNPAPVCHGKCSGESQETQTCNTEQRCPTHGAWSNWGPWSDCSSSCIPEGSTVFPVQTRSRLCNNPSPSSDPPGRRCNGDEQDIRDCSKVPFCPVDGQWGEWEKASGCSVTCGIGRVTEKRSCNNPAPRHGGRNCAGSPIQHHMCNTRLPCPVDGQWMEWGAWTSCSLVRETIHCKRIVGLQSRRRTCQKPKHNGKDCPPQSRDSRHCYDVTNCTMSGDWSEWSQWGLCSSACGQSERTRYKECLPVYLMYPKHVEGAVVNANPVFSGTPRVRCTPINGETLKVEEKAECKNLPPCT